MGFFLRWWALRWVARGVVTGKRDKGREEVVVGGMDGREGGRGSFNETEPDGSSRWAHTQLYHSKSYLLITDVLLDITS